MHELIEPLRGKFIVSVQAYPGEPMRRSETMAQTARAVQIDGAATICCQGFADISTIKGRAKAPIIDLRKGDHEGVYITPSLCHVCACIMAGCDIAAIGAISRPRLDGYTFAETCWILHEESVLVMADYGSLEDARAAHEAKVDVISTTLAGHTNDREKSVGPDLELLKEIVAAYPDVAVICGDHIHAPQDTVKAMNMGALTVIVNTGITHPTLITIWFEDAVEKHWDSSRCAERQGFPDDDLSLLRVRSP